MEMNNKILKEIRKLIANDKYQFSDNFFEAGGTSMQVIELARIVYENTGSELDMMKFFSSPILSDDNEYQ